jgi:hypothetical protein
MFAALPFQSSAQKLHPFLTAGLHSDGYGHFAGVGGGGVYDFAHAWVSAGAEGDVFFSGGYAAGRAGPIVQLNILQDRSIRPFAISGYKWGEGHGAVVGGGMEFRPGTRPGFRVSIEDIVNRVGRPLCGPPYPPCSALPNGGNAYFRHAVSAQFGVVFR